MEKQQQVQLKEFLYVANALLDSMNASMRNERESTNIWRYSGFWQYARKYNQLVQAISQIIRINTIVDLFDMEKLPSEGAQFPHNKRLFLNQSMQIYQS